MKFLVEILSGLSFEIEVDNKDTLLQVKQKIERSQGIPVSKQTLIVDGIVILREDLNVEQCQIVHDSHIQVDVSAVDNPNYNDDQMLLNKQYSAPGISAEEYFEGQDWPLTEEEIRKINSYQTETTQEISKVQDSPVIVEDKNNQVLQNEIINIQDSPLNVETTQEISKVQDLPVMLGSSNKNQVPHQTELSPASESVKGIPVKKRSNMKIPTKTIHVFVRPYSIDPRADMNILVTVNATDEVRTLRDELAQKQKRGMLLPQDSYFLMHKKELLDEYESYEWNGVQSLDTIELVPRQL